jgi:hypothetical protein
MIPYLGCEAARRMLDRFADGELAMSDQVALESHLRWCQTCAARVEDTRLIAASIRRGSPVVAADADDSGRFASMQSEVLARIRAERDQSFGVWVHTLFQDMRLWWPALGATAAVAVCILGVVGVLRAASDEHPHSLAGLIQLLAHPGSDGNPLPLDSRLSVPRVLNEGVALDALPAKEAAFALATVVTREGRIANYELLQSDRIGPGSGIVTADDNDVRALLNVVRSSRFEPAQAAGGGAVAVNMVWLVAHTTVKGARGRLDLESQLIEPIRAPQVVKRPDPGSRSEQPPARLKPTDTTTEGRSSLRPSTTA